MSRGTPSGKLVIFLVSGLVLMCGGLILMMEYAKVEIKKRGPAEPEKPARVAVSYGPDADRLKSSNFTAYARAYLGEDDVAWHGRHVRHAAEGEYRDLASGEPLFSSRDKLESRLGYVEFSRPLEAARLVEEKSTVDGEARLQVKCRRSGARLGWIVTEEDGARRYVLNSSVLEFVPAAAAAPPPPGPP